jgi:hypothetical protein
VLPGSSGLRLEDRRFHRAQEWLHILLAVVVAEIEPLRR